MADGSEKGSWWTTTQGVVTGVAGLLTAFTGLLLAVHQIGWLGGEPEKPVLERPNAAEELRSQGPQKLATALKENPIIPGRGLAGISIGDPEQHVIDFLGTPTKFEQMVESADERPLYYAMTYQQSSIFLGVYSERETKKVRSLRLSDGNFNASGAIPIIKEGVTIGSSEQRLLRAFGKPVRSLEHVTCPLSDRRTTSYVYDGIEFWVCHENKKIYLIDIRL